MSVLKPRTRVVYFRVSEEEFGRLNELCEAHGARSLSDLARAAMREMLGQAAGVPAKDVVTTKLETLERLLTELHQSLKSRGMASPPQREASGGGGNNGVEES